MPSKNPELPYQQPDQLLRPPRQQDPLLLRQSLLENATKVVFPTTARLLALKLRIHVHREDWPAQIR